MLLNQRKSKDKIPLLRVPDVSVEDLHKHVEHSTIKTVSSGYVKVAVVALFFGMSVLFYRLREGWGIADSFLFVIITISTVGYGTIHPTTNDSRVYTIFLMVFGVVAIFSTLTSFVNKGIKKLKVYLSKSVVSRLKQTEWMFQQRLYFSVLWIVLCAFMGAVVLQQLEGWDFISCLYFIVETITTVGYGDFTVEKEATKIFLCFYIVISVTLLGLAIQNLYSLIRNRKVLAQRKELLVLQQKLHFLADMNEGRGVNKFEFVLTILEHIGTLDHDKDIAPWLQKFKELDTADIGVLDQQQLAKFSESNEKECEEQIELLALSASNLQQQQLSHEQSVPLHTVHRFSIWSRPPGECESVDLYQQSFSGNSIDDGMGDGEHHLYDDIECGYNNCDNHNNGIDGISDHQDGRQVRSMYSCSPQSNKVQQSQRDRRYSTATNMSDSAGAGAGVGRERGHSACSVTSSTAYVPIPTPLPLPPNLSTPATQSFTVENYTMFTTPATFFPAMVTALLPFNPTDNHNHNINDNSASAEERDAIVAKLRDINTTGKSGTDTDSCNSRAVVQRERAISNPLHRNNRNTINSNNNNVIMSNNNNNNNMISSQNSGILQPRVRSTSCADGIRNPMHRGINNNGCSSVSNSINSLARSAANEGDVAVTYKI